MASKMKLAQMLRSIGVNSYMAAMHIERATGVRVTKDLLDDIIDERHHRRDEKPPIVALPKAEALCKWLSDEMGRDIKITDIDGLEVV